MESLSPRERQILWEMIDDYYALMGMARALEGELERIRNF